MRPRNVASAIRAKNLGLLLASKVAMPVFFGDIMTRPISMPVARNPEVVLASSDSWMMPSLLASSHSKPEPRKMLTSVAANVNPRVGRFQIVEKSPVLAIVKPGSVAEIGIASRAVVATDAPDSPVETSIRVIPVTPKVNVPAPKKFVPISSISGADAATKLVE